MAIRPPPITLDGKLSGLVSPTDDITLSMLLYGEPGVGKTVLAGTAQDDERTRPVLFCSAEGGHRSILWRLLLPDSDPRAGQLFVKQINKFPDDMYEVLRVVRAEPGLIRTIVIDSLTDMAWRIEQSILAIPNAGRKAEGALAWDEYGPFNTRLRGLITAFRDLHINFIATALEKDKKKEGVMPIVGTSTTSALLPGFFDTVGRLSTRGRPSADGKSIIKHRVLGLDNDASTYVAKDRNNPVNSEPPTLEDPTITKLLDRAEQGLRAAAKSTAFMATGVSDE